jgi:DNA-directed RNA polymerase subunit RPC12/RpoP
MSTINLADVNVSYEGQNLPAMTLLSKLQTQLQEVACRLATISSTLGDLQGALLNSETIEVKLTLSREDVSRLRSLGGDDDSERIRKAVMTLIHPEEAELSPTQAESRLAGASAGPRPVSSPVYEFRPVATKDTEPAQAHQPPPIAAEPPLKRKSTTACPTCQAMIDLPEMTNDPWSVEIQCGNCGAKSLVKSTPPGAGKTDKSGSPPPDAAGYKKLFDTLAR